MQKIAIAGAGSVGCYVAATLAAAGRSVSLLVRPSRRTHLVAQGIHATDLDGRDLRVAPGRLDATSDPSSAFAGADIVLVCVKSGDTAAIAADIAAHAPPAAIVISLQNGIGNEERLANLVTPRVALPGVVMFNVVLNDADSNAPVKVHRATSGGIYMPAGHDDVRAALSVVGLEVVAKPAMRAVAWGKLLLNLNNAINALSGLPLAEQLAQRPWRKILADQTAEALAVLAAANVKPAQVGSVRPQLVPHILRLPDALFRILAAKMLSIDPAARSSMWEDLERRRPTEIDYLQGEILRLAHACCVAAPISERLTKMVKAAEAAGKGSPRLQPAQVRTP
jgi:2-dehydropantoate 2-reductase